MRILLQRNFYLFLPSVEKRLIFSTTLTRAFNTPMECRRKRSDQRRTKFPPNTRKYSGKRPEKSEKACRREEKIWKRYLLNWGKWKWGIRSRSNIVWFPDGGGWRSSQKLGHSCRCWLCKLIFIEGRWLDSAVRWCSSVLLNFLNISRSGVSLFWVSLYHHQMETYRSTPITRSFYKFSITANCVKV